MLTIDTLEIIMPLIRYIDSGDVIEIEYELEEFARICNMDITELSDDPEEIEATVSAISEMIDELGIECVTIQQGCTSIEDGYADYVAILKVNDKFYGVPYTEYRCETVLELTGKKLTEYSEYKPVQTITYQPKYS